MSRWLDQVIHAIQLQCQHDLIHSSVAVVHQADIARTPVSDQFQTIYRYENNKLTTQAGDTTKTRM